MQDLWRASSPESWPGPEWRSQKGTALLGWWWAIFLISSFATGGGGGSDDDQTIADLRSAADGRIFGFAMVLVASGLAIAVVVRLTRRSDRHAELPV
jgi:hypothetical protein